MEKIVNYFKNNPILFYVIIASIVILLIAIFALLIKKNNSKTKALSQPTIPTSEPVKEPAPIEEKPLSDKIEEEKIETVKTEPIKQESAKVEEIKQASTEEEELTQPPIPQKEELVEQPIPQEEKLVQSPIQEEQPEPAKAQETKVEISKTKILSEEKTTKKDKKPRTTENKKAVSVQESNQEAEKIDEIEQVARYSGKWIICRVMTKLADQTADDEMFFFELHASNGEKLLTSEEYTTYQGALNGLATHKSNIEKGNLKITLSKKGDYIFKLLNGKNMLLCVGEHYATKTRCESAIESTKRFAKTAVIDENVQDIVITPPADDGEIIKQIPDNGYVGKWIVRSKKADNGDETFFFELYASNGEKLLSSEEYTSYIGAVNGIATHKTNIEKGNFRISLTKQGDYIYKLLNGNGQLLCLGEHYKTKSRCQNAVESVKRFAKNASVLAEPEIEKK